MPEGARARASVVIAAHNEAAALPTTLNSLLSGAGPDEFEVVVVANGCTDDTADVARSYEGVNVLELTDSGKAQAINAAEQLVRSFPRVYLDADIQLTPKDVRRLCSRLAGRTLPMGHASVAEPLAVSPARRVVTTGRPLLVRAYYAVNSRLPAFDDALFGRGAVVVSELGRRRFGVFPPALADDLFLDSLFGAHEKRVVPEVEVSVLAPGTTRELLSRLERVRRGNLQLRRSFEGQLAVRPSRPFSWLAKVVASRPWLTPAAVVYAALTIAAELKARRAGQAQGWGRDRGLRGVDAAGLPGSRSTFPSGEGGAYLRQPHPLDPVASRRGSRSGPCR